MMPPIGSGLVQNAVLGVYPLQFGLLEVQVDLDLVTAVIESSNARSPDRKVGPPQWYYHVRKDPR
jgi:hypothetical protein